jgi:hypothetical protein
MQNERKCYFFSCVPVFTRMWHQAGGAVCHVWAMQAGLRVHGCHQDQACSFQKPMPLLSSQLSAAAAGAFLVAG